MRIIDSTWQGSEIADGEERDSLRELIDSIPPSEYVRQSYTLDPRAPHQKTAHAFIAPRTPDDDYTRWVTYYGDTSGTEYIEHDEYNEAVRAYEQQVRELQDTQPEGSFWWGVTDVDGVPTGGN